MAKPTTMDWLRAHVAHRGNRCLIWPFSRRGNGYGQLCHGGKRGLYPHRLICELAHGPAPTPRHECAHSCGMGKFGCVNPSHLSWKTPAENQADRVAHGNGTKKGEPRFKLTREQVDKIRSLAGSKSQVELAKKFGVTWQNIGLILRGEAWPDKRRSTRTLPKDKRPSIARRAYEMRQAGATYQAISKKLGIARLTARRLIEEVVLTEITL